MILNRIKSVLLLLALGVTLNVGAQDAFQRLMTANAEQLISISSVATPDEGFLLLNIVVSDSEPNDVNKFHLSKHNTKGDQEWAQIYTLEDVTLVINIKSIDLSIIENDTIMINGYTQNNGIAAPTNFVFKADPTNGELIWSGIIEDQGFGNGINIPSVVNSYRNTASFYNAHSDAMGTQLGTSRVTIDENNEVISNRSYTTDAGFAVMTDAIETIDSNEVVSFVSDPFSTTVGVMQLDTLGNILSGNSYSVDPDSIPGAIVQTLAMASTPDTGLVHAGFIVENGPIPIIYNYLMKTDSIGQIQWVKFIDTNLAGIVSQVNDVVCKENGEIAVSAKYIDQLQGTQGDYILYFDKEGNILRQLDYGSENSLFVLIASPTQFVQFSQGELSDLASGGTLYTTVGIDPVDGALSSYVVKTDVMGNAFCSDTLAFDFVSDYALLRDTLIMQEVDLVTVDTLVLKEDIYDNFNMPILQLLDTFFCPQDPINVTLNATIVGATTYEWSTGETTPTLDVFEEGEYSVTVTVGEKICYALCDTSRITQGEFPEAMIEPGFTGLCELGRIDLRVINTTAISSVLWSTGETSGLISITEPGDYSVTITDNCDNMADANFSLSDADFELEAPTIELSQGRDTCDYIIRSAISLSPNVPSPFVQTVWSNGETSPNITVSEPGIYTITVTDACGTTSEASTEIEMMDDLVQFPNVFFPIGQSSAQGNRLFGPFVRCPDAFSAENFTLQVFNRFGNKVFESDNVSESWNGNYNGDGAPRGVYMYQWSYDDPDGITQQGEGTVTLYR